MWTLRFTLEAAEQIGALHGKARLQVERALKQLRSGERRGKALRGELRGILSERVGNLRILYREVRGTLEILVLTVAHRRLAYGGH